MAAQLRSLNDKERDTHRVPDDGTRLVLEITKTNYTPARGQELRLRRGDGGILLPWRLETERLETGARLAAKWFEQTGEGLTRRQIEREKVAKPLQDHVRRVMPRCTRKKLAAFVDEAERHGLLRVVDEPRGRKEARVYRAMA